MAKMSDTRDWHGYVTLVLKGLCRTASKQCLGSERVIDLVHRREPQVPNKTA